MRIVLTIFSLFLVGTLVSQERTVGLFLNAAESYNGYTLLSNNQDTYLIDNCGLIVNQWRSAFSTFGNVRLRDDGTLVRLAIIDNENFRGGGSAGRIEIFSWEGELIWSYQISDSMQQSHHDIEIMPNGNILALVWERIESEDVMANGRDLDNILWMEKIVELEVVGVDSANIVWEWNTIDHLIQDEFPDRLNFGVVSEHPGRINMNYTGNVSMSNRDWLHLNSIDYNPILDQIAISTKHLNEVWIIDHSTTSEEAATNSGGRYGKGGDLLYRYGNPAAYNVEGEQVLSGQHSVSWISDRQLMVLNNNYIQGEQSSVDQWTLPVDDIGVYTREADKPFGPFALDWQYTTPGFHSNILSSAQLLPNDNILICLGLSGEIIEVDRDGVEVWRYINSTMRSGGATQQGQRPAVNSIFQVWRYGPDFTGFDERVLESSIPVEDSPIETECEISVGTADIKHTSWINLMANPVTSTLNLDNTGPLSQGALYTVSGTKALSFAIKAGLHSIDISYLSSGIYYMRIVGKTYVQTISLYKE